MKIDVWGSCITRDALSFLENYNTGYLVGRQSIISACSKPLFPNVIKNINISYSACPFIKRVITEDIDKTSIYKMQKQNFNNLLIIDLTEERTPILECNNCYVTLSHDANTFSNIKSIFHNRIQPFTNQYLELFKNNIKYFSDRISYTYDNIQDKKIYRQNIIIHRAFFAEIDSIHKKHNNILAIFYDLLAKNIPNNISIEVPKIFRVSSPIHKWGGGHALHLIDEYYIEFLDILSKKISYNLVLKKNYTIQNTSSA